MGSFALPIFKILKRLNSAIWYLPGMDAYLLSREMQKYYQVCTSIQYLLLSRVFCPLGGIMLNMVEYYECYE